MNRKIGLKQAFELLYRQSSEHDSDRTLMYGSPLNKSDIERGKQKLSTINLELKVKCMSWKTKVFRRLSRCSRARKVKSITMQKQHLRDITDKLHLLHFMGDIKDNPDRVQKLRHRHKRKTKSMVWPFLVRNVKKVKKYLKVPIDEERKGFGPCTPRKIKTQSVHVHNIQSDRKTLSTHKQNVENTDKKSTHFDSGFYELEELDETLHDEDVLIKSPFQTSRKRTHLEEKSETPLRFTAASEFSTKKGRFSSDVKKLGNPQTPSLKQSNSSLSAMEKKRDSPKNLSFKPLFSNHCGSAWKNIVEEN